MSLDCGETGAPRGNPRRHREDMVKHAMNSKMCSYNSCIAQTQCKRTQIYRVTTHGPPCVGCEKLGEIKGAYTLYTVSVM